MGWKTILGAVVTAVGWLSQPEVFNALPERAAAVVTAAGAILAAVGLRHAIYKGPAL